MGFGGQDSIDSGASAGVKGKEFLEKTVVLTWKKQSENSNNYFLFFCRMFQKQFEKKKIHKLKWVYIYI